VLRDFKYELPSTSLNKFTVTEGTVTNPNEELRKLMQESVQMEASAAHQSVHAFAREFSVAHSLDIRFTDPAVDLLVSIGQQENRSIQEVCHTKFKDFQFGLKLIAQNTGRREFLIDTEAVQNSEKVLSEWVVQSYKSVS
jgi:hypothetical protein